MSSRNDAARPLPEGTELRAGETVVELPPAFDAQVYFIGRIRTPWRTRRECPRAGDPDAGPLCRVEIDTRWHAALVGIEQRERLQLLYWMDRARRDLTRQSPASDGITHGTFALRSPNRPNPIASSVVRLVEVEGSVLAVRGLDCLDGTPLIDVKPDFCIHAP